MSPGKSGPHSSGEPTPSSTRISTAAGTGGTSGSTSDIDIDSFHVPVPSPHDALNEVGAPLSFQSDDQEPGSDVVVIQPGTRYLRVGLATDIQPVSILHCIARAPPPGSTTTATAVGQDKGKDRAEGGDGEGDSMVEEDPEFTHEPTRSNASKKIEKVLRARRVRHQSVLKKFRPPAPEADRSYTEEDVTQLYTGMDPIQYSAPPTHPQYLIGHDAECLPPSASLCRISWPFHYGRLRLGQGCDHAVLADIRDIWCHALQVKMKLSRQERQSMSAVLIVSDFASNAEINAQVSVLFHDLGFRSVIIHLESVMVSFGCGVTSGIVVDVGASKSSVCCIEDGQLLRGTRKLLPFGGWQVMKSVTRFLKEPGYPHFPYTGLDLNDPFDRQTIEDIHKRCYFSLDLDVHKYHEFQVRKPGSTKVTAYTCVLWKSLYIPPMGLFYPDLFQPLCLDDVPSPAPRPNTIHDPEQPCDRAYLRDTSITKTDGGANNDRYVPSEEELRQDIVIDGIDAAIEQCIQLIESDELKVKLLGNMVLSGGASMYPGFDECLEEAVADRVGDLVGPGVEITVAGRAIARAHANTTAWVGGSVFGQLDSTTDAWVSRGEWLVSGSAALRAHSLFAW